jgi:hypothetical protein
MTTETQRFDEDGLVVKVLADEPSVHIKWEGVSDSRDPGTKLGQFLQEITPSLKERDVTIDFRSLEYVNSATVSPIVQFVKDLDGKTKSVTLLFNTSIFWQRTQYRCMRVIASALQRVEVKDQRPDSSAQQAGTRA